MITIVSVPKPFNKKFGTIQHNAISSWRLLSDDIILFGDDLGVAQAAKRIGVRQVTRVKKNEYGTPILSDIFSQAQKIARYDIIAYINADVILFNDFPYLVKKVAQRFKKFLFIGKRRNIDVRERIVFRGNWKMPLFKKLQTQGREKPVGNSSELFVFPKIIDFNMQDFAIGRLYWDSWLIYRARFLRIPVIDATPSLFYLHQIHDYSHHKQGFKGVWYGEEAQRNFVLSGGSPNRFKVADANYVVTPRGISKPSMTIRTLIRRLRVFGIINPYMNTIVFPIYVLLLIIFKIGMILMVLPKMNSKRFVETILNPRLLGYKLKEL